MSRRLHHSDSTRARGVHTRPQEPGPPVFLISVDMISPDMYGRGRYARHLHTPNLDRIRRDGVWFDNAFCNSPLCGPSRASYLTGRYPYLTVNEERAHDGFETELRPDDIIFPEYLRAAGYRTRHVGKCHVGTAKFMDAFGENDSPWNRWAPPVSDDDEYALYCRHRGVEGMRLRREVLGLTPDRCSPGNSYGGWVEQANGSDFPIEATYPHYLAHRAAELIRLHANAGPPPYLQLDFFAPHQPFFIPAGLEEREAALREVVELPESYRRMQRRDFSPPEDEPYVYQQYTRHWGLYEEETMRDYLLAHLLQMEVLDAAIGVFVDALRESGLYEKSLLVFLGDHGEMNGHRALIDKGVYGHPRVERVPLCMKLPDGEAAGHHIDASVCLLDLAPTVLQAAGISVEDRMDGESLLPLLRSDRKTRVEPFLFESGWHVTANPAVSIQKRIPGCGHLLYTYNVASPHDELYDLEDEACRNLATDPEYQDPLAHMIRYLAGLLQSDPRWRCYWHAFRLEKHDRIELDSGDTQMFTPE